jgi:hypothetical protein
MYAYVLKAVTSQRKFSTVQLIRSSGHHFFSRLSFACGVDKSAISCFPCPESRLRYLLARCLITSVMNGMLRSSWRDFFICRWCWYLTENTPMGPRFLDSFIFIYIDDVRTTQETRMALRGLLQEVTFFNYNYTFCETLCMISIEPHSMYSDKISVCLINSVVLSPSWKVLTRRPTLKFFRPSWYTNTRYRIDNGLLIVLILILIPITHPPTLIFDTVLQCVAVAAATILRAIFWFRVFPPTFRHLPHFSYRAFSYHFSFRWQAEDISPVIQNILWVMPFCPFCCCFFLNILFLNTLI